MLHRDQYVLLLIESDSNIFTQHYIGQGLCQVVCNNLQLCTCSVISFSLQLRRDLVMRKDQLDNTKISNKTLMDLTLFHMRFASPIIWCGAIIIRFSKSVFRRKEGRREHSFMLIDSIYLQKVALRLFGCRVVYSFLNLIIK